MKIYKASVYCVCARVCLCVCEGERARVPTLAQGALRVESPGLWCTCAHSPVPLHCRTLENSHQASHEGPGIAPAHVHVFVGTSLMGTSGRANILVHVQT